MKKALSVLLVLIVLCSFTVGSARAANGLLTLLEVRNDPLGGVIFIFNVSGEFGRHELRNGTVHVQGGDGGYGIHCNRVAEDLLQCTTTQKVAGKYVWLNLAGFTFWAYVPLRVTAPDVGGSISGPNCYGVYDTDYSEAPFKWAQFETHCQDDPAVYGETIQVFNPNFNSTYTYEFMPDVPPNNCGVATSINEDAYYYNAC